MAAAPDDELMCANCGHSYAQHTKGANPIKYCRHCLCVEWVQPAASSGRTAGAPRWTVWARFQSGDWIKHANSLTDRDALALVDHFVREDEVAAIVLPDEMDFEPAPATASLSRAKVTAEMVDDANKYLMRTGQQPWTELMAELLNKHLAAQPPKVDAGVSLTFPACPTEPIQKSCDVPITSGGSNASGVERDQRPWNSYTRTPIFAKPATPGETPPASASQMLTFEQVHEAVYACNFGVSAETGNLDILKLTKLLNDAAQPGFRVGEGEKP